MHSWMKRMRCSSPLSERSAIAARGRGRLNQTNGKGFVCTHKSRIYVHSRRSERGSASLSLIFVMPAPTELEVPRSVVLPCCLSTHYRTQYPLAQIEHDRAGEIRPWIFTTDTGGTQRQLEIVSEIRASRGRAFKGRTCRRGTVQLARTRTRDTCGAHGKERGRHARTLTGTRPLT